MKHFGTHRNNVPWMFWRAAAWPLIFYFFLVPNVSTSWLYFTPAEMLAVNRAPIKSCGTIYCLERLALSSFFSNQTVSLAAACMHTSRGQSCHFRGHRQISANSGWCGSAPYNHPDVSNQLDFYYPPLPLFILSAECQYIPQEAF